MCPMSERPTQVINVTDVLDARSSRLRDTVRGSNIDAVIISDLSNLLYLTNLRASAGILVVGMDRSLRLLLDFRYLTAAAALINKRSAPSGLEIVPVTGSYEEALVDILNRMSVTRIGVESGHMTVRQWRWLNSHTSAELIPLIETVERLRMIKDEHELDTLRRAGRLLSEVVPDVLALARRNRSEMELAQEIDRLVLQAGFERLAFETIAASGPNSALPHAQPTARELSDGDLVILDFGGVLEGYCVDICRSVAVGIASEESIRLYTAVYEAQLAAIEKVMPGVTAEEIDAAARVVLDGYGFGERFGHSTGHGLGLDVHELPRVGRARAEAKPVPLECGMVFTVEPGVYVPGVGGVRIEDDVVVTESGVERLTLNGGELVVT